MTTKEKRPSVKDRHQKDIQSVSILAAFVAYSIILFLFA